MYIISYHSRHHHTPIHASLGGAVCHFKEIEVTGKIIYLLHNCYHFLSFVYLKTKKKMAKDFPL
ncbi:unnamed protein product, partial [Vitis vinifera]